MEWVQSLACMGMRIRVGKHRSCDCILSYKCNKRMLNQGQAPVVLEVMSVSISEETTAVVYYT